MARTDTQPPLCPSTMKHVSHLYLVLLLSISAVGCGGSSGDAASNTFELAVTLDGPGSGTVASSPAGIACGSDCTELYPEDTVVTLTASRATGSLFAGWGGACSGSDNCAVTMDAARSVTASFVEYAVDCSPFPAHTPSSIVSIPSSTRPAVTTVIVMHGKTSIPADPGLLALYDELALAGYDVIAPDMPWSDTLWDGSMCAAMNLIDELAAGEAAMGRDVVVAGHSMGGAHALIYTVTTPSPAVKAIIAMAPGHFPHLEGIAQILIADEIARAENLVAAGLGDNDDTFGTLLPDPIALVQLVQIGITPNNYLSFHALDQYPDIRDILPATRLPVLWLAGADDALTDFYGMAELFGSITSQGSTYDPTVTGDHLDMVASSASPMLAWLLGLGL